MKHSLEVDSVILEFGSKRVLQDVFLKSETGFITGLLGRNGTGKSCLMKIIFGLQKSQNRSVRIDGKVLLNNKRCHRIISYLPQFSFIPKSLKLKRIFKDFQLDFNEFINAFPEFEKYYRVKFQLLSGGEQRIVEIYSILMYDSLFCMLDEPFSQVMPLHVETIKKLITQEKKNKGIILTDHLYDHIIDICDDLYVINFGKTYLTSCIEDIETLGYINISNQ